MSAPCHPRSGQTRYVGVDDPWRRDKRGATDLGVFPRDLASTHAPILPIYPIRVARLGTNCIPRMILCCARYSAGSRMVGMEAFAEVAWLQGGLGLSLSNGIPSHDTLSEVMGRIDLVAFRAAFTVASVKVV